MYDEKKDKLIKLFTYQEKNSALMCSIFSYNSGEPKLALTKSFTKNDGTIGYSSAGRLTIDQIKWLYGILPEIIEITSNV